MEQKNKICYSLDLGLPSHQCCEREILKFLLSINSQVYSVLLWKLE
jgi:hypothetical protein